MSSDAVVIERALPRAQRERAAAILDEAFRDKMRLLFPEDHRLALMTASLDESGWVTASLDGELVGVAGIRDAAGAYGGGLTSGSAFELRALADRLGWIRAIWARSVLVLKHHQPLPDELYIDAVAVSSAARGHGVGTRLLDEVAAIAQEAGHGRVRLEVVDTNPRARALYERTGYVVVKEEHYGFLRRFIGFGGSALMELTIP